MTNVLLFIYVAYFASNQGGGRGREKISSAEGEVCMETRDL